MKGSVFISLSDRDKEDALAPARAISELGFTLFTTAGTHDFLEKNGIRSKSVRKNSEVDGAGLSAVDIVSSSMVDLVINTPLGRGSRQDGWLIRTASVQRAIPIITTIAGFKAAVEGIKEMQSREFEIESLQEWQGQGAAR